MVEDADELYALDPGEFTAARNALAKHLKAAGRTDDAAAVAKLRRPTPAAWALDQVAREAPQLIERALEAGAALRKATDDAVAGDARALRTATAEDRAATDAVVDAAAAKLGGRGPAARQSLAGTLRAAVLDDAVAEALRRGVLATDHEAGAFGFGFGADTGDRPEAAPTSARPRPAAVSKPKARATGRARDEGASAKDDRARRAAERAEREAAEAAAREARRRRADLEAEVKRLDHRHERLARIADRAEDEARRARAEADAAALEAEAGHRQLEELDAGRDGS